LVPKDSLVPKPDQQAIARKQLEELRAERARREAAAKTAPVAEPIQVRVERDAPPEINPVKIYFDLLHYRCTQSFRRFVVEFWDVVNPGRPLEPSVAIDVMCDALQATLDGGPRQLLIACPPGVSKSILCAVMFPAWLLLRTEGRARIMVGSYSWDFCERDSTKCRDLVACDKFQKMLSGRWALRADKNAVDDWWTTTGGRRLITSVKGKSTGERVDFQIVDDPLSAGQVRSDADRREATRWVGEVLSSRLDDKGDDVQDRCVRIIVHQRLAVDDPIGTLLSADPDGQEWAYCRLPAILREQDVPTSYTTPDGRTWWRDNRKVGEPLFKGLGPKKIERMSHPANMGAAAVATQYFQDPVDDSAATIRRGWWRFYYTDLVPPNTPRPANCNFDVPAIYLPEKMERIVIACDLTFGSTKGDYAAVQAWGARGAGRFMLALWRKRAGLLESVAAIRGMARRFPGAKIIVEKAANGAGACEELLANGVPGVIAVPPLGKKKERIGLVSATIESGCAFLPLGLSGLSEFVEELAGATKHDDQQDAAAYGIHELNKDCVNEWPEARAERERAEAEARGEAVEEPPSQLAKLNSLWLGVPIPGKPVDVATGKPPRACAHEWIDARCRLCYKIA
jgi:hypothetical protein